MNLDNIIASLNEKIRQAKTTDLTTIEQEFFEKYQPEKHFIVYGTLAPEKPNHFKIEHIKGTWHEGFVRGKLENKGWGAALGYDGFKHCSINEQKIIKAYILFSEELNNNWAFLDNFEGNEYQRVLAKFELDNKQIGVGYIYALNN